MKKVLEMALKPNNNKRLRLLTAGVFCLLSYIFLFIWVIRGSLFPEIALFILMLLLIPTVIFQVIVLIFTWKVRTPPIIQAVLYLLPCIALIIYFAFAPTGLMPQNQKSPLVSYNGRYTLTVPVEKDANNHLVWKVTIKDKKGKIVYKDEESKFVGHLNVYWVWDKNDNVWLYNSDDSYVYFWSLSGGKWIKQKWGYGRVKEINEDIHPPEELYPSYEK